MEKFISLGRKSKSLIFSQRCVLSLILEVMRICPMLASAVGKRLVSLVYKMGIMACSLLDTYFPKQA